MSGPVLVTLTAFTIAAVGCAASPNTSGDVQAVLARDREWARVAATSRNVDSVVAYWTDDARVVLPGEAVLAGKPAIRAMIEGTMKIPGFHVTWMPDSAVVSRSGDLGYSYGTNAFTVPDSTGKLLTTRGRYITVWRKGTDGQWRCSEDYSSPSPSQSSSPK
jgi:ketosteroid isomerase-like protein